MMTRPPPRAHAPPLLPGMHPRLWLCFVIVCLLGTGLEVLQYTLVERIRRQYEARSADAVRSARLLLKPVEDLCKQGAVPESWRFRSNSLMEEVTTRIRLAFRKPPSRPSRCQVEKILNKGQTFVATAQPVYSPYTGQPATGEVAIITDPRSGLLVDLYFLDGVYIGHGVNRSGLSPPEPPWLSTIVGEIGSILMSCDRWLWLAILPLCLLTRKHRVLISELALMAAIAAMLVRMPSPFHGASLQTIADSDALPWSLVMVSASLVVLCWAVHFQSVRLRVLCPVCEYNLSGSISGVCPECGTRIPPDVRERLAMRNAGASGTATVGVPPAQAVQ